MSGVQRVYLLKFLLWHLLVPSYYGSIEDCPCSRSPLLRKEGGDTTKWLSYWAEFRICCIPVQSGKAPVPKKKKYTGYDTDGKVPVLKLWGVWSISAQVHCVPEW